MEEEDTFSSFLTIKEENVISTGEISHIFLLYKLVDFRSFTRRRKSEPVLSPAYSPNKVKETVETDPEEEISDTSSFSTMKQKFYYANKILALQKKVAEQVPRY